MKIKNKIKLNKNQKIIVVVTSIALVLCGGYGYIQFIKEKKLQRLEASIVDLYQIPGREKIFMNGKILPVKSQEISINPEQGELSQIKVENNSYVEKGSPLFTCKNSSQIKEIESLKLEISAKIKEKSNAPDEETKLAIDAEIKQLNSQVDQLNKTAYSTVYAPFSGKVYLNESTDENQSLMTLETIDLYVKGKVNERDSYKIRLDQGVEINVIATNDKYSGLITNIGDRPYEGEDADQGMGLDAGMTKYEVNMSIENQTNLKNGLNVQIIALSGTADKKIPNVSVLQEGDKYYVYKVENNIVKKVEIKVKEKKDEYYLVEKGIRENDEIIKDVSNSNVKDGEKVYTGRDQ